MRQTLRQRRQRTCMLECLRLNRQNRWICQTPQPNPGSCGSKCGKITVVARLDTQDDQYQKARLLCAIGEEALEVYNAFEFEAGQDSDKVSVTIAKFGDYFTGDTNETYERFKFNQRSQADGETFDNYLTELKNMRKTCNFCQCLSDSLLRDRIVLGIRDDIA